MNDHPLQELKEREKMVYAQETLLKERFQLERKKFHSKQQASREFNHLSVKLATIDSAIHNKEKLRGDANLSMISCVVILLTYAKQILHQASHWLSWRVI